MSDLTILTRADWGGGPVRAGHDVPHEQFGSLFTHHTDMVLQDYDRDGFLYGDLDDIKRYMRALQAARPDLGSEVPYSFVGFEGASPDDIIIAEGRGWRRTGAHTIGHNSSTYGFAFAGNTIDRPITPGMVNGVRWIGAWLHNAPNAGRTRGHQEVYATACPGTSAMRSLPWMQPPFYPFTPDRGALSMADVSAILAKIQTAHDSIYTHDDRRADQTIRHVDRRVDQLANIARAEAAKVTADVLEEVRSAGVNVDEAKIAEAVAVHIAAADAADTAGAAADEIAREVADELAARLEQ